MLRRRPFAATFFGIANIIVGTLGLFLYTCSGLLLLALTSDAHTATVWEYLADNVRLFRPVTVAHFATSLLICLLLLPAGIGLLGFRNWGRLLSVACAGLAVVLNAWNFLFQIVVVGPALQTYIAGAMHPTEHFRRHGDAAALELVVYGGSGMACVYSIIMAILLLLPDVASAFRQGPAPAWADDFEEYDDRPRRRRRRYDEWDD